MDSYIGGISTANQDTIKFDYGWYSNSLEVDPEKHHITYQTINSKKAKIVQPKNFGSGTTGAYFEKTDNEGLNRFEISGEDLDSNSQSNFLLAIKTIKF